MKKSGRFASCAHVGTPLKGFGKILVEHKEFLITLNQLVYNRLWCRVWRKSELLPSTLELRIWYFGSEIGSNQDFRKLD